MLRRRFASKGCQPQGQFSAGTSKGVLGSFFGGLGMKESKLLIIKWINGITTIAPLWIILIKDFEELVWECSSWIQNHLGKPENVMLQNATHLRKSSSWNICDRDVSCSVPATRTASLQILLEHPPPASVLEIATKTLTCAHF